MFVEALPAGTRRDLALLAKAGLVQPFYLAGGTAVALYLGHRVSVDLDFFGPDPFDSSQLAANLADLGQFSLDRLANDTLLGELQGIKISFFRYRYPLIGEPATALGVRIASLQDLAAMKLDAISRRGTRRDFVDLYFIARSGLSLANALQCYRQKYAGLNVNVIHVIKSLAYFADAEKDPMPVMLVKWSWDEVKRFFQREAKTLFETL
ncbi:MAG: nucleotidyl transferase AbiEii/AbiGii toxin family protein [Chloroflexi bacterium]|nr:nucleotidyl transferase AbiEii/AbiGii toxin family protein [Chloroflexota bacterium]